MSVASATVTLIGVAKAVLILADWGVPVVVTMLAGAGWTVNAYAAMVPTVGAEPDPVLAVVAACALTA